VCAPPLDDRGRAALAGSSPRSARRGLVQMLKKAKAEGMPQLFCVGAGRFELPTSRTRTVRATKLRYAPNAPRPPVFSRRRWGRENEGLGVSCQAEVKGSRVMEGLLFQSLDQLWDGLEEVSHETVVGDLEDRGVGVFIDGHNHLRAFHARDVLNRT
jgi:hypothetical protein